MFSDEIVDISSSFQVDSLPGTPRSVKSLTDNDDAGFGTLNFNLDEVDDPPKISNIIEDDAEDLKSVNFGGGLDLLINNKFKDKKNLTSDASNNKPSDSDLDALEMELNNLTADTANASSSSSSGTSSSSSFFFPSFSGSGGGGGGGGSGSSSGSGSKLGKETASSAYEDKKTWDGFGKLSGLPVNPDKPFVPPEKEMSKDEMLKEKFRLLKRIQQLEKKYKVEFSKKYTMDSSYAEMKGEYESVMEEKEKVNSIKWHGNMLMMFVNGVEYLNNKWDPFDVNLDGWSDQVSDNLNEYDDIFEELHEKYKSKGKWAPELRLLFQLGGSAFLVHMSNKMFKSSLPSVDDIFKQNPDLMKQFQSAAINSMGNSNPNFSGFMNNVMGLPTGGPPPPPLPEEFITQSRGGNNFRPPPTMHMPPPPPPPPPQQQQQSKRAEMKGPSDISDILSSLKTKSIHINKPSSPPPPPASNAKRSLSQFFDMQEENKVKLGDLDVVSVNSNGDSIIPKKSKRKNKSNANTLSLDI